MKRLLYSLLALVSSFTSIAFAQSPAPYPGAVCYSNTAETIGQGVLIPIPSAQVSICAAGASSSSCLAGSSLLGQTLYTDQTKATVQPNPITADVGGNFYFCVATPTHFSMLVNSGQGSFWTPDLNLVDNWANGGTINGNTEVIGFFEVNGNQLVTGNLTVDGTLNATVAGTAATANALTNTPTNCGSASGQFAYGIQANGNALCNPVYYNAIGLNGVGQTQRNQLNFTSNFTSTDSSSPSRTTIDLASNISVNAATATALAAAPTNCGSSDPAYGIGANGNALCIATSGAQLIQTVNIVGSTTSCTTASTAYATCVVTTITWPQAFANNSYAESCFQTSLPQQGVINSIVASNNTTTTSEISIYSGSSFATPAQNGNISCIGVGTHP